MRFKIFKHPWGWTVAVNQPGHAEAGCQAGIQVVGAARLPGMLIRLHTVNARVRFPSPHADETFSGACGHSWHGACVPCVPCTVLQQEGGMEGLAGKAAWALALQGQKSRSILCITLTGPRGAQILGQTLFWAFL